MQFILRNEETDSQRWEKFHVVYIATSAAMLVLWIAIFCLWKTLPQLATDSLVMGSAFGSFLPICISASLNKVRSKPLKGYFIA